MNAITKSGTNGFHGSAFEFLRNDAMDARGFFDPYKAELRRNQFGYAAGGPFWKNKLFWFTDYQGTLQVTGASTGIVQLPSDAQRTGVFNPASLMSTVKGVAWANTADATPGIYRDEWRTVQQSKLREHVELRVSRRRNSGSRFR